MELKCVSMQTACIQNAAAAFSAYSIHKEIEKLFLLL